MTDDRFKQARRSLIDRQNQSQPEPFGDFEDEATAMVDLDAVHSASSPGFGPPPNMAGGGYSDSSHQAAPMGTPDDGATEMFSIEEYEQSTGGGVQMPSAGASASQSVMIGDDVGYEGKTAFINLADLAAPPEPDYDDDFSSEVHTEFVDLNALNQAAPAQPQQQSVENDPILHQGYQFGPEAVQQGEFTLIFTTNGLGQAVVLKRIWEGDVSTMPPELQHRIAALDPIRHPHLLPLNGMFASPTGGWVELARPPGFRLTDILNQSGPQAPEVVQGWMVQVADVLTAIHQFGFVYANLTTDAIWIQDDGSILLEPFDILTFENRGDLGPFGSPELQVPPAQRQVFPSTDVYSLAAVTIAAITGLPVNLGAVAQIEGELGTLCVSALNPNPVERLATPQDFVDSLAKTGGKGGLPALDTKKKLAIGLLVVMIAILGAAFYVKKMKAEKASAASAAQAQKAEEEKLKAKVESKDKGAKKVGALTDDPRLEIVTSFKLNPVEKVTVKKGDEKEIEKLQTEAREVLKDVNRLVKNAQRTRYETALQKMVEVARMSGGELSEDDQVFLVDLYERKLVRTIRKETVDQVAQALKGRKLTSAKLFYQQLENIDPNAKSKLFFNRNKSAKVRHITREGGAKTEEAEK